MKFTVGYQLMDSHEFIDEIINHKENISEVYFSWDKFANGRSNKIISPDITPWEAHTRQQEVLKRLSDDGLKLNLLLNATCYGKHSQSRSFFKNIGESIDFLMLHYNLTAVTTTSPLIAKFIKSNFEKLDVRASVNMEIGTIDGMEYIKEYFDSFYVKREFNRDFTVLRTLKKWCEQNGKVLYALANSGCLNNCSAHVFHDNLVSHESEISEMDNGYEFKGICRKYIESSNDYSFMLQKTNFIRPEDIYLYDNIFSVMKLATRTNVNPVRVLKAYTEYKRHSGSVFELLEPDHTALLYPYLLENSKIKSNMDGDRLVYTNYENALIKLEGSVC